MRVLWVTNDLPPRAGGIERFVGDLLERVHPASTTVLGPPGPAESEAHDAARPYEVRRAPGALVPGPRTRRLVATTVREVAPDVVVLGAAWPLAMLVPTIRRQATVPVVALTHGLEAGMARAGLAALVRLSLRRLDAATTISAFTARALARVLAGVRTVHVPPGVDTTRFRPGGDGGSLRAAWGVPTGAPVVGCVSRLVARKGQDSLVRAWPRVLAACPDAWLVLVGEGPRAASLARAVQRLGAAGERVVLAGRAPDEHLPDVYAAFDVAALPCRTRWAGIDVEGLGIVLLEAQACGRPVVAGRSGGAPEAVGSAECGTVVDGRDIDALADALVAWLADPAARARAAEVGPPLIARTWGAESVAARLRALLDEVVASTRAHERPGPTRGARRGPE